MAYINLNVYEEIEARELIDFVRSLDSKCASMSDEDLRMFIYEHINTLVLRYLDTLGVEHGDVEWGDGIDELWEECNDYLNEGKLPKKVTYKEKIEMMKRHLTDLVSEKGEKNAVFEIRTHFLYYLKGLEGSSEIKNMICKETSFENIIKILDNYLNQLDNLL